MNDTRTPTGAVTLDEDEYRTLAALIAVYDAEGRATVRRVADAAAVPFGRCYRRLRRLRRLGLATWAPGKAGTLRPLYDIVAAYHWEEPA